MATTRWGIIGAGLISHDFALALTTLPATDHILTAVSCITLESAQGFAAKHSIPHYYSNYRDMLQANNDTIDIVYIGTIHPTHYSIAMEVLEYGKPILCEKPMTLNAVHTKALIDKAREKGLFLMEATWMRFFPACIKMNQLIADGFIGQPKFVRVNFSFRRPAERAKGRLIDPSLGGGCVLDVGMYAISFATMIFGGQKPIKIHAVGSLLDTGVDDLAVITLSYPDGGIASLTCSISYNFNCDAIVCGTKSELQLPHPFWCSTRLETPKGVYDFEGVSLDFPLPPLAQPTNYPNSVGLRYEAQTVREYLLNNVKESDIMPLEHSLTVAEIADEVLKQIGVKYENI